MSKINKSKTTAASKKQIAEKLAEIGLTIEEAKKWLKGENESEESCSTAWNKPCCTPSWDFFDSKSNQPNEVSNVIFAAGRNADTTRVYVGEIPVEGIIRAKLEYDTELGVPTLQLDILNPNIALSNSPERF